MSPARTAQWLLLDVPAAPEAGSRLQHGFAGAARHALFANTDLHGLREQGPQVIELASHARLADCVHDQPEDWPGLLLQTSVPAGALLEHLRRMLTVTFGLHHKGLLSYYNPWTASYFFDARDASELSRWLGPIDRLYWYGGTWADRAMGSLGWQQMVNPRRTVSDLAIEDNLSQHQQDKLQTCLLERHAWSWCRATGHDYGVIWCCLEEGLEQGFTEHAVLDGWLRLRLQYPSASLQVVLPGGTQQERLDNLRQHWRNDPT